MTHPLTISPVRHRVRPRRAPRSGRPRVRGGPSANRRPALSRRRPAACPDMMTKAKLFPLGLALALPILPLPAVAQSSSEVEEMVITATRVRTPVSRLPAGISVVTRAEIEASGWQTLPDALRLLPSASVVSSGGPGANTSVFLRGTNSDHVLVLLDGLPVNDPSLAAGAFNFGDDVLGGLQRIEVVRGPASTLYGSNAIGGVINLITRAGADRPAVAEIDLGLGTDGTKRGTAGLFGTMGRLDYGLSLQGFTTDGDNATPDRLTGGDGEEDGFDNLTATAKAVYRLDAARLEGLVRWRESDADIDNVPLDDPNSQARAEQLNWQTAGELDLLAGALTSRLAVGQSIYDRRFTNAPDAVDGGSSNDRFEGARTSVDWQNSYALPGLPVLRDAVLVAGASYVHETVELDTRQESEFGPFTQQVDAEADGVALFAHAQARVAGRLNLTAGLRHDRPDDYGSRTTWRLGGVVEVPELNSRLTAAVGTAYKAPGLYDRYGVNNFGYQGNPDLEAEESFGWEAGVETDLAAAGRADFATLGITWFANDVDDLIQYDFVSNSSINIDEAEVEGVEASLELRPADWAELRASWTWTDARDGRTGARLARRPENAISLLGRFTPVEGLSLSPEAQFVGQRQDVVYGDDGSFLGNQGVGGYWLVNLAVTYAVLDNVELYARATNLADRAIENPNGFAQPDRGVLAGVRARF